MGVGSVPDIERLYREHGEHLWRAVLAFARDREVANDAVAEAFAQALRRGAALRDPLRWVWRAAFRIAAGELAQRRRGHELMVEAAPEMPEVAGRLIEAPARVSRSQRAALVLHYYRGYPVKDIARIIGSTAAAVRVHLSTGRKRLRALLEEESDDA